MPPQTLNKILFDEQAAPPKGKRVSPEVHRVLFQAAGTDLLAAEGFGPTIVMRLLAEVGTDMSAWPTEGHFTSWARLCPRNNITGGRRRRAPGDPKIHRVKQIFKTAAYTVTHAKSVLGAYYRSVSRRRDAATANAATAHKLARIFDRIMKFGETYVRQDAERYEAHYQENIKKGAVKRLKELGFEVTLTTLSPAAKVVSFQTTKVSPWRSISNASLRPGRSARVPLILSSQTFSQPAPDNALR